ncbi:hypothetical protein EV560_110131 [Bosea sp. BK604]|nr:hypothetical protein EV560_110131 [Bosea sp. BK604]
MSKRFAACSLLVVVGLAATGPAQAGILEDLARAVFGRPARLAPTYLAPEPLPLDVTVRPQHRKKASVAASAKPKPPAIKLDPETEPYWYLRDPTLRRGDIVVARSGALVFEGPRESEHVTADFVALEHSRLVPKAFKQRINAAVAGTVTDPGAVASANDRTGN